MGFSRNSFDLADSAVNSTMWYNVMHSTCHYIATDLLVGRMRGKYHFNVQRGNNYRVNVHRDNLA